MANELTIRIAGEAGQGMQTIGSVLCRLFKKSGYHIFSNQDYMSRVRGGNNFFQLRIADKPLYAPRRNTDILVALDKPSVSLYKADVREGGILVLDKKKFGFSEEDNLFLDVPLFALAAGIGGADFFINTVASGVIAGLLEADFGCLQQVIKDSFARKDEEVVTKNISAARAGFDFVKANFKRSIFKVKSCVGGNALLMNGNDAIALGAIRGGCKFFSAYPMSPSTSILNSMAHYAGQCTIAVEQAEDEIAAVNMAIGASFAGVRSMTATSGGGFALMTEGVSLAAMTETPVVIVVAQRPGPATGFPTRTEQADLDFVLHAGHGEFARAVYAPGTIEEAFYLTVKALNIAEKFQIPVFILTDQFLADSERTIETFDPDKSRVQRSIISRKDAQNLAGYKRYQLTESGVSPRAIPSWLEDVFYVDSDEHTEEGHITEDADVRRKMVEKRFYKKISALAREIEKPTAHSLKDADKILVGFGSTYGVMREASEAAAERKIGFIHISQVWPFPSLELKKLLQGAKKKVVTVENNAGAQLAKLLKRETGIDVRQSILRFDGRPFTVDYLMERIQEIRGK